MILNKQTDFAFTQRLNRQKTYFQG